jgi:NAD(P)-dependent dehydrogenase (short-subunit alcohol dehydrogenase family)
MDLMDPQAIEAGVAEAARLLGGLDGLINNAAVTNSGGKYFNEISVDTWDQVMQVNVRGSWLVTRAAHPHLKASGRGRVVNLASDTALWGAPRLLAYVASKGAVIAMTHALAREMGPDSITVNAIAPGIPDGHNDEGLDHARMHERARRGVDAPLHSERRHREIVEHVLPVVQIEHRIAALRLRVVIGRQTHDDVV